MIFAALHVFVYAVIHAFIALVWAVEPPPLSVPLGQFADAVDDELVLVLVVLVLLLPLLLPLEEHAARATAVTRSPAIAPAR